MSWDLWNGETYWEWTVHYGETWSTVQNWLVSLTQDPIPKRPTRWPSPRAGVRNCSTFSLIRLWWHLKIYTGSWPIKHCLGQRNQLWSWYCLDIERNQLYLENACFNSDRSKAPAFLKPKICDIISPYPLSSSSIKRSCPLLSFDSLSNVILSINTTSTKVPGLHEYTHMDGHKAHCLMRCRSKEQHWRRKTFTFCSDTAR